MRTITLQTQQHTQLIDITEQVQAELGEVGDAVAVLVYVPHTTAGVTINEAPDPLVARDLEMGLARIVDDSWPYKHVEDPDGPNAPSHVRGSLMGPNVVIPLDAGQLALGTYQGIFFCEFDGPRTRKVYVTPLR